MKRILLALVAFGFVGVITAQPPARIRQQQAAAQNANSNTATTKVTASVREFPVQPAMPDDVTWRRDLYRALDLRQDANAPLYYPVEPQGNRMSLFTYLFKLMLRGQLKAYTYSLDGNENFNADNAVKVKDLMDSHHIYYEQKDGRIRVNDADLPSSAVTQYFIKESSYYDPVTASFHTKVDALCPVLVREDEFGGEPVRYPLFWVKYDDVAEYLARLPLMVSNFNNAATMSANDYFAMNRYDGKIYKTNNMQGRVLGQINATDSAAMRAQAAIEKELKDVQTQVWGNDTTAKHIADSIAAAEEAAKGTKTKTLRTRATRTRTTAATKEVKTKEPTVKAASSSSATPRVTVRRQRR